MTPLCATVDPDLWTSDHKSERYDAADLCWTCPLRPGCFAEADRLRQTPYNTREDIDSTFRPYGVWGGFVFYGNRRQPTQLGPFTDRQRSDRWKNRDHGTKNEAA